MKALNFTGGPWKEFFSGYFFDYEVRLFKNQDDNILSFIIKRDQNNKISAMVCILYSFFVSKEFSEGDIVIERKYDDKKIFYIGFLTGPRRTLPTWESINDTISNLYESLKKKIKDVKLTPISKVPDKVKVGLFEDPVAIPQLFLYRPKDYKVPEEKDLLLGISLDNKPVKESPGELVNCCIVGEKEFCELVEHILAESYVLAGIPVMIFTTSDTFSGLNLPNQNRQLYSLYYLKEPCGFPTVPMKFTEDFFIDLRFINPAVFAWWLNLSMEQLSYLKIESVINENRNQLTNIYSLERLIVPKTDEKRFHVYRAKRIINILSTYYPNYFGVNDYENMTSKWLKGLGKISIIKLTDDKRLNYLILNTILNGLLAFYKNRGKLSEVQLVIIFHDGEYWFGVENLAPLELIFESMERLVNLGVSFVFDVRDEFAIYPFVRNIIQSKIVHMEKNIMVVRPAFKRLYKVKLRPPLSTVKTMKYYE
jgi:hypothetical protein